MDREAVLQYEARRRLYRLIREHPGVHLRELERLAAMPLSTLRYHLGYLEDHGLVEVEGDRQLRRHFARGEVGPEDRQLLAALRQEVLRRIVLHVLHQGGTVAYRDLRETFPVSPSTLGAHLAELTRRGVFERVAAGRESFYRVRDPDRVLGVLFTYRRTFLDSLVDHLLDVLYPDGEEGRGGG